MKLSDDMMIDLNNGLKALEDKHFAIALRLLTPIAELGHSEAQHRVAIMHQNGLGVVRDEKEAFKWMQKSAAQGCDLALHGMGFMYLEGEGVEKNPAEAAIWFKRAADAGLIGSMTTLAEMYKLGNGVEQNTQEAERLLKLAGF